MLRQARRIDADMGYSIDLLRLRTEESYVDFSALRYLPMPGLLL